MRRITISKLFTPILASLLVLTSGHVHAQPSSTNPPAAKSGAAVTKSIDTMLRAHIQDYFGDESVPKQSLGIRTVNGIAFDDLKHGMSLGFGGAVTYLRGKPIIEEESPIVATFQDDIFVVEGIANGKGGFKTISSVKVAAGTMLILQTGATFQFSSGSWKRR